MRHQRQKRRRRGMGTTEWVVVATAILLACVTFIAVVGRATSQELDGVAVEAGDPASLPQRFGSN